MRLDGLVLPLNCHCGWRVGPWWTRPQAVVTCRPPAGLRLHVGRRRPALPSGVGGPSPACASVPLSLGRSLWPAPRRRALPFQDTPVCGVLPVLAATSSDRAPCCWGCRAAPRRPGAPRPALRAGGPDAHGAAVCSSRAGDGEDPRPTARARLSAELALWGGAGWRCQLPLETARRHAPPPSGAAGAAEPDESRSMHLRV